MGLRVETERMESSAANRKSWDPGFGAQGLGLRIETERMESSAANGKSTTSTYASSAGYLVPRRARIEGS